MADQEQLLNGWIDRLAEARLCCLGDVMLDRFLYGRVERISPEAPVPVLTVEREEEMLGGAGNVARNLTALGAKTVFTGSIGDDAAGRQVLAMTGELAGVTPALVAERHRVTPQKIRHIAGTQQLLRSDHERVKPVETITEDRLIGEVKAALRETDILILSDYGKGTLTPRVVTECIAAARAAGKRVIIDPKRSDPSFYRGATLLTPNRQEFARMSGEEGADRARIAERAKEICRAHDIASLLVTLGPEGMLYVPAEGEAVHVPARAREVFDVSGAGDTVVAVLAAGLAIGAPEMIAAQLANLAAGIVVGKVGTAVIYRTDMKAALHSQPILTSQQKISPLAPLLDTVARWKAQGQKVGFTNGCFDLVHQGHVTLLARAKAQCDRLVVALNSDDSVRRLKGETRPVKTEMERALILAAFESVDAVVIFREDTPLELIRSLKPDILFKGADYTKDRVVGGDLVEAYGGEVALIPLEEGFSTTGTLARIGSGR